MMKYSISPIKEFAGDSPLIGEVPNGSTGELSLQRSIDPQQSHLQDKLHDLQAKKQHMDQLLQELQTLRDDKFAVLQQQQMFREQHEQQLLQQQQQQTLEQG